MFSHNLRLLTRVGVLGAGATVLARVPSSSGNSTSGGPGGARCEAAQGGGGQAQLHRAPQHQHQHHHHQHEQSSSQQHHALESYEKDSAGFVGVFLDAASVEKVQNAVGGTLGRNAHALIHLHPDPATKRSFAPLFGSKVCILCLCGKIMCLYVCVCVGRELPFHNICLDIIPSCNPLKHTYPHTHKPTHNHKHIGPRPRPRRGGRHLDPPKGHHC